jgi:hypothetical protein
LVTEPGKGPVQNFRVNIPEYAANPRAVSGGRRVGGLASGSHVPAPSACRGTDEAGRGSDPDTGSARQARGKAAACGASAGSTAPQPQIAMCGNGSADRRKIVRLVLDRFDRPGAGGEIHSAWRAMSNYMDGIETANAVQGHGDLPRGRRGAIEYESLDPGAQVAKNRCQIVDRRIDEQHFGHARRVCLVLRVHCDLPKIK